MIRSPGQLDQKGAEVSRCCWRTPGLLGLEENVLRTLAQGNTGSLTYNFKCFCQAEELILSLETDIRNQAAIGGDWNS